MSRATGKVTAKRRKPDVFWSRSKDTSLPPVETLNDPAFPVLRNKSNDVGTANWGTGQFALITVPGTDGQETIVIPEHKAVLSFKSSTKYDALDVTSNMYRKFNKPNMAWHWRGEDPIICEQQVDHLLSLRQYQTLPKDPAARKMAEQAARSKAYAKAINFATYNAFLLLCHTKRQPLMALDLVECEVGQCVTPDDVQHELTKRCLFKPVSSRAKTGLRQAHGSMRKTETAALAIAYYRETGQNEVADWMETLATQKPREDAGDIFHQARWELEARHKARCAKKSKKRKRDTPATTKPRKRQEIIVIT